MASEKYTRVERRGDGFLCFSIIVERHQRPCILLGRSPRVALARIEQTFGETRRERMLLVVREQSAKCESRRSNGRVEKWRIEQIRFFRGCLLRSHDEPGNDLVCQRFLFTSRHLRECHRV